jgi:hypothetical protein
MAAMAIEVLSSPELAGSCGGGHRAGGTVHLEGNSSRAVRRLREGARGRIPSRVLGMKSDADLWTRIVSGVLFPLHERLKGHSTTSRLRELEASQWW